MEASQFVFICGLVLTIASTLCAILSFSLDYWLQTPFYESSVGLKNIGLWKVCFESFYDATIKLDKVFHNCHWIYSSDLDQIRWPTLNPPWFVTVQILAIINLVMSLCSVGSVLLVCCTDSNKCPLVIAGITNFFMTLLGLTQAGMFGVYSRDPNHYKIDNIERKEFGAGWYFIVLAALSSLAALILLLVSYITLRSEHQATKEFHQARQRY